MWIKANFWNILEHSISLKYTTLMRKHSYKIKFNIHSKM